MGSGIRPTRQAIRSSLDFRFSRRIVAAEVPFVKELAKPSKPSRFFAYSRFDVIPVLAGAAHFAYVLILYFAFRRLSWWLLVPLGLVYSVSISWNINGISHNFLHNPYFR